MALAANEDVRLAPIDLGMVALIVAGCVASKHVDPGALLDAGRLAEAEAAYRAALREHPEDNTLKDGLGAAIAGQGRHQEGCPLLTTTSRPLTGPECWLEAARRARDGQKWASIATLAKRTRADKWPEAAAVEWYAIIAQALRQLQHWDELLKVYPRMLALRPEDGELHYLYARALESRHQDEQALREYELALSLDPDDEDIRRALGRLKGKMAQGSGGTARIEALTSSDLARAGGRGTVSMQEWDRGTLHATIVVGDDEGEAAPTTGAAAIVPMLDVEQSQWPAGRSREGVLLRVASYVDAAPCRPAAGSPTSPVTATWGPDGNVKRLEAPLVRQDVRECLERVSRGWLIEDLTGGFLRVRFPYPP